MLEKPNLPYYNRLIADIESKVVPDLIKPSYLHKINTLLEDIPRVGLGCLECRLEDENDRVDFQVCPFIAKKEFIDIQDFMLHRTMLQHENTEIWNAYHDFAQILADKKSFANAAIPNIWLVYDILDLEEHHKMIPWLYCGLLDHPFNNEINFTVALQVLKNYNLVDHKKFENSIRHFHSLLPRNAYLCAIGLMHARKSRFIRLAFKFPNHEKLLAFLNDICWEGDIERVFKPYEFLFKSDQFISLAFDLGETMQIKVGIERAFGESGAINKINHFANQLVELNICTSAKKEAMLKWHQAQSMEDSTKIKTWINHFKFVFEEVGLVQTKAYLFYQN